jgi:chorismate mutase/prephenate dehydratase
VPIENSTEGMVNSTRHVHRFDLKIAFEIMLEVRHNLLSRTGKREDVKKIYSHQQPRAQCREWLEKNFPGIPIIEETSTAAAARRVSKDPSAAAVASELAASVYNLKFIEKGIEDYKNNFTRFLVIAKESLPDRQGRHHSLIKIDHALYSILRPFCQYKISLTKIESRLSGEGKYIFFIDMEGHI